MDRHLELPSKVALIGHSRTALALLTSLAVLLVGILDYTSSHEVTWSIFYAFPIGLATWYVSIPFAALLGVTSVALWIGGDIVAGAPFSSAWVSVWNALIRVAFYGAFIFTLSLVRDLFAAKAAAAAENEKLLKVVQCELDQRKRAEAQKTLLLREMDHRVKNLFSLSSSIVSLSARNVATTKELVSVVQQRLCALVRAHSLAMQRRPHSDGGAALTLHSLIRIIAAPYEERGGAGRIVIDGADFEVGDVVVTHLALLLHELTTNAAKYGALSVPTGSIAVSCRDNRDEVVLEWIESGGPPVVKSDEEGFGTLTGKIVAEGQLKGSITHDWNPQGLRIRLVIPRARLAEE